MRTSVTKQELLILSLLCGLVILIHFPLLSVGTYQKSYDAYTHLFFTSHWMNSWWVDFEPRWYTGFSVFLYPPFSHHLVAIPAFIMGIDRAFVLVQTLVFVFLLIGIYRYSRIWFSKTSSYITAFMFIFLSSMAMTVHFFGQYPNTVSLALMLNTAPFIHRWIFVGKRIDLYISLVFMMPAFFTSLFSNFFGIAFFMLPVFFDFLVLNTPFSHWVKRPEGYVDEYKREGSILRLVLLTGLVGLLAVFCLSPFFWYLKASPFEQMPIPHGSRRNILALNQLSYVMFYGLYGPMLLMIPFILFFALKNKRFVIFFPSMLVLLLFSTGGAIPLNKVILGDMFNVITFDRFSLWNSILVLPLVGHMIEWFITQDILGEIVGQIVKPVVMVGFSLLYLVMFYVNATAVFWIPLPPLVSVKLATSFLNSPEVRDYRYITLGLGGFNLSNISIHTNTQTLDGNYNFARRIPELNQSPIALIDEAKYYGHESMMALSKFLLHPAKYNLKYLLLVDKFYTPLLRTAGWEKLKDLNDHIEIWEAKVPVEKVPEVEPHIETPYILRFIWGFFPLTSFIFVLILIGYKYSFEMKYWLQDESELLAEEESEKSSEQNLEDGLEEEAEEPVLAENSGI